MTTHPFESLPTRASMPAAAQVAAHGHATAEFPTHAALRALHTDEALT